MPLHKNIGHAGTNFASETQRQFNELRGALHRARESFAHLKRMIGVAKIRKSRGHTSTIRSDGFSDVEKFAVSGLGEFISGEIGSNSFASRNFYRSASQTAARLLDDAIRGQRTR